MQCMRSLRGVNRLKYLLSVSGCCLARRWKKSLFDVTRLSRQVAWGPLSLNGWGFNNPLVVTLVARQYGQNTKSSENYDKQTYKNEHGTVARAHFATMRSKNGVPR